MTFASGDGDGDVGERNRPASTKQMRFPRLPRWFRGALPPTRQREWNNGPSKEMPSPLSHYGA